MYFFCGLLLKAALTKSAFFNVKRNINKKSGIYLSYIALKTSVALAFIIAAAGLLLHFSNFFLEYLVQCFPEVLWQYFAHLVLVLLFLYCCSCGLAPAHSDSVVMAGSHGKQLELV